MVDDLSDIYRPLRELADRVRRLENTQLLSNASVTEGRLRFIGGLLLHGEETRRGVLTIR